MPITVFVKNSAQRDITRMILHLSLKSGDIGWSEKERELRPPRATFTREIGETTKGPTIFFVMKGAAISQQGRQLARIPKSHFDRSSAGNREVVALATRLPSMLLIWFNHVILDIGSFTR
jgi:hypothetical protein